VLLRSAVSRKMHLLQAKARTSVAVSDSKSVRTCTTKEDVNFIVLPTHFLCDQNEATGELSKCLTMKS